MSRKPAQGRQQGGVNLKKNSLAGLPQQPRGLRRCLFAFAALVLVPLTLFSVLEIGLRVFGIGHPVGFFSKWNDGESTLLTENAFFTWRFFPPQIAKLPPPLLVNPAKPTNDVRIVVFGESAALGDPEPAFGFGRMMEVLLQNAFAQSRIEVVNVSITAINSHVIVPIAKDCAKVPADLWIIYMGNNEFVGPFGPGTVLTGETGGTTPAKAAIKAVLFLRSLRIGQFLDRIASRIRTEPSSWGGMEMFTEKRIHHEHPSVRKVYRHFSANLQDILQAAQRRKIPVLLCTVPTNLKDCPPFASLSHPDLKEAQLLRWKALFSEGCERQEAGQHSQAILAFEKAAQLDASFAELRFRMAQSFLHEGNLKRAAEEFRAARDWDALPFRADSSLNEIIRDAAQARGSEGVSLVDLVTVLEPSAQQGIPGRDLFYEHVHLNWDGNYLVGQTLAESVAAMLEERGHQRTGKPWLESRECARALAYTKWNDRNIVDQVLYRMQRPPFSEQYGAEEQLARFEAELGAIAKELSLEGLERSIQMYRQAIKKRPGDWVLRDQFARLLEDAGDLDEAGEQWTVMAELLPHSAVAQYKLAENRFRAKNFDAAWDYLHAALEMRPFFPEAFNLLGAMHAERKELELAEKWYVRALQLRPDDPHPRINYARLLMEQKDAQGALKEIEHALKVQPRNILAQRTFGEVCLVARRTNDALRGFVSAALLESPNATNHFAAGRQAAAKKEHLRALAFFSAAAALEPNWAEVHYQKAVQLLQLGYVTEATRAFAKAVELDPAHARARFNLGVGLAKVGAAQEAAAQFRQVLQIEPGNETAANYLQALEVQQ